ILAFDHRGSFQRKFFGIEGEPDSEQTAIIADAKHLIFEGMLQAVSAGADSSVTGVLVDEQFGSTVPAEAREHGLKLAMPAERSARYRTPASRSTSGRSRAWMSAPIARCSSLRPVRAVGRASSAWCSGEEPTT